MVARNKNLLEQASTFKEREISMEMQQGRRPFGFKKPLQVIPEKSKNKGDVFEAEGGGNCSLQYDNGTYKGARLYVHGYFKSMMQEGLVRLSQHSHETVLSVCVFPLLMVLLETLSYPTSLTTNIRFMLVTASITIGPTMSLLGTFKTLSTANVWMVAALLLTHKGAWLHYICTLTTIPA